ncbi:hypothetical protein [Cohnella phaseoli]|uniref:Uncharacterized protein n=1 Tax=Cohnella phaseoli TaxID=456490 RepID=A0A3D9JQ11_9BACL|nr:hypothetical protein [Cohnella phaseoli]RED76108.1 hypothetical protein DFP98_113169 [Cohnella phaseoli]
MSSRSTLKLELEVKAPQRNIEDLLGYGTMKYDQSKFSFDGRVSGGPDNFAGLFTSLEPCIHYEDFTCVGQLKSDCGGQQIWDVYAYQDHLFISQTERDDLMYAYCLSFFFDNLRGHRFLTTSSEAFKQWDIDLPSIQRPYFMRFGMLLESSRIHN